MKTIDKWDDLMPYGIEPLTAEACGLMYRLLCDVTEKGKKILAKCFGTPDFTLAEPWNHGYREPHVGSVMLAHAMLVPIGIFALLESRCTEVWLYKHGALVGIEPTDDATLVAERKCDTHCPIARTFAYRGTAGDRNIHVMTGRIQ